MKKILLLRPPELYGKSPFPHSYVLHECLGIGYLTSYLRAHGQSVQIIDAHIESFSAEETIEEIIAQDCGILGISIGSSLVMPQVSHIIQAVKKRNPEVHIAIGGHFPTFYHEPLLDKHPEIDTIVRFEGEETLLELVQAIEAGVNLADVRGIAYRKDGRVAVTPNRPLIADLDLLPFPARDTLPKLMERGGLPLISGSRGCPARCSFCSVHSFYSASPGKIWRPRSIENIIEEVRILEKVFGCHELWFVDDNFLGFGIPGRKRARDFFTALNREPLTINRLDFACRADSLAKDPELLQLVYAKRRGLVSPGIEAGVQRILDLYHKGTTIEDNKKTVRAIKESRADIKMEFILFNPWITFDEVKETIRFLEEVDVYDPCILTSTLTIMRHTSLADEIKDGHLEVTPLPAGELEGFDQNSFVPYQITDEKVMLLFKLVTSALPQLEYALAAVLDLRKQGMRRLQGVEGQAAQSLEETCVNLTQLINLTSLDIFKEALEMVENSASLGNHEQFNNVQERLRQKSMQFAKTLRGLIEIASTDFFGVS